jgi:hypothetical protein
MKHLYILRSLETFAVYTLFSQWNQYKVLWYFWQIFLRCALYFSKTFNPSSLYSTVCNVCDIFLVLYSILLFDSFCNPLQSEQKVGYIWISEQYPRVAWNIAVLLWNVTSERTTFRNFSAAEISFWSVLTIVDMDPAHRWETYNYVVRRRGRV